MVNLINTPLSDMRSYYLCAERAIASVGTT